ncbi:DNA-directed RNA polymerase IV subunit 1 isoform X1 [Tanacetum coccineum]
MIAQETQHLVKEQPSISIPALTAEIVNTLGYTPSYKKVWVGKDKAIERVFGSWDESYMALPKFLAALQSFNPGTIVEWSISRPDDMGQVEFRFCGLVLQERLFGNKLPVMLFGSALKGCLAISFMSDVWLCNSLQWWSISGDIGLMDNDVYIEQQVPSGVLTSIRFKVLSEEDAEKASVKEITVPNEVTDPALGFPNPASQCHTCGAKDYRTCEGHIGLIKFPFTILHPYFLLEVAQILNKICPGCKNLKKTKKNGAVPVVQALKICKYCDRSFKDEYPSMKFKVSSKDVFGKSAISVEIVNPKKLSSEKSLPSDYWDFVAEDSQQEETFSSFSRKILTHAQVYQILKDVDPSFLNGSLAKKNKIFMQNFPLTPNCHRVAEFGQNVTFDERTRAYRKMVGFRGTANELSTCVTDCIKLSKIRAEKPTIRDPDQTEDNPSKMHGLKYMKEVSLGKRTDFCFRLVCVGDPYIKLDEIGVPRDLAETMLVSEQLNSLNWERINASCGLKILQKGETFIRRRGGLVPIRYGDQLRIGDTVYRPLHDGDIVLVNRPPSIHPHSLIALRVKVLPINCVLSYNPLVCDPFRGDFDGDSLHGYIPQSLESRVELRELVSLENQLVDKQSGKNLISLSHDSLTGAHLMLEDGVFFNRPQLQQLQMFCRRQKLELPAVMGSSCLWTGRQLFSLVLDKVFDANVAETQIKNGEFVSFLNPSSCLQAGDDNIYSYLIRNYKGDEVLEFLHSAQELMIEWLSSRGFSVSLLDLYLSSDSKHNMKDEVLYGLYEAERQAHGQLLMVDGHQDFLIGDLTGNMVEKEGYSGLDSDRMCYDQQTSAALSRASNAAFKEVFRDVQNLIYNYATRDNSLLSMLKAGSKGNMLKFVQHSMCVGYQHSLVPLSFHFPREFSCVSWNDHKRADSSFSSGVDRYVPYGVIKSSFLSGLNPMELFVHSVTNRDASFGGHADISGTLFRKLMFFMRDLYIAYDGTVRNCYGNQLVQFSYNPEYAPGQSKSLLDKAECGAPVGSLAACAISEAAYGALDQPVSALENSPLLNLKKVLECGVKKLSGNKTASLFLSQKLKRWNNGFEYGAIDVKNHLEKLLLKDVVSLVSIFYSPQTGKRARISPWICYFGISKEVASSKQLSVEWIINALKYKCADSASFKKLKLSLPKLEISSNNYPEDEDDAINENDKNIFITVQIVDAANNSLNILQDVVVPFFLEIVIKGSINVKKVDIVWQDDQKTSKHWEDNSGELYLRVFMSENCDRRKFWRVLKDDCIPIMEMIDWERSHPDDIQDLILAQGIDAARNHFLRTLKSAIEDTGKHIVPEHLALAADCLSATGEFIPINAKGLSMQRSKANISAPFTQACFANPSDSFLKAAKSEALDNLEGTIDALSWGKVPGLGTGSRFEIIFSGEKHQIDKPVDVFSLLSKSIDTHEEKKIETPVELIKNNTSIKKPASLYPYPDFTADGSTDLMKMVLKNISASDIKRLAKDLKHILHRYGVNDKLSQDDKLVAWKALFFHPRRDEKIGIGLYEIKIGHNLYHENTRCFMVERVDGTTEDFSYHKCIHHALKLIAPFEAKVYESRWLNGKEFFLLLPLKFACREPGEELLVEVDDIQNGTNELLRIRDYLFKELAQKTGQPVEQEALDYGLIDRIVRPPRIKADAPRKEAGTGLG